MHSFSGLATFDEDFKKMHKFASLPVENSQQLIQNLTEIYRIVYHIDFSVYDVDKVRHSAPKMVKAVFNLRLKLHDQIPHWNTRGILSLNAQKALRSVFRVLRYTVDILGELVIGFTRLEDHEASYRAFTGHPLCTLFHPSFDHEEEVKFCTGDVLLVRGSLHNSAAIARIGDMDSQFSHISIIHKDLAGKFWVIESLIERGAVISPLDEALDHGLARAILLRHKNKSLAKDAAQMIYNRVMLSQTGKTVPIPYDFSMKLDGYDQLYCSKLIRQAFDEASGGKVKLPTFMTQLDMKNRDFLNRIGVTAKKTFAPGDMEIEPTFDIVAEWRDYRQTSHLRLQDMIMTKFFEWMDAYNYKFKEDMLMHLIGVFGKASSYLSKSAKSLLDDLMPSVPSHMSRRTISTIAMLYSSGEEVLGALKQLEHESIAKTGRPLHPRDIFEHLEYIRQTSDGRLGYLIEHR
ncbi:MAG: YiiX/YebB-like N1pC/P60 family cysteine hydrolase [Pseudomonadota bacterium]